MPKELNISAAPHETRVAILEDGLLLKFTSSGKKNLR